MKKTVFLILLLVFIASSIKSQTVTIGDKAPSIKISEWINNNQPDLDKKPVFLDFFATWCGPCRKALPHIEALANQYHGKINFVVLSNEEKSKVTTFFSNKQYPYYIGLHDGSMAKDYGVKYIPYGVLIDRNGKIIWMGNSAEITEQILNNVIKK